MGRSRKPRNAHLPPNLYENGTGYYIYRHPQTGKKYGMGKRRAQAIEAAKYLNAELLNPPSLSERVLARTQSPEQQTFGEFVDWFEQDMLPTLGLAETTCKEYRNRLVHIKAALGSQLPIEMTVSDIALFIDNYSPQQSNNYRSLLNTLFKHAIARGLCENNPADATMKKKVRVMRQRLTLEAFTAIRTHAPQWMQNAMDLALLTLQRREDIAALQWTQIKDGAIWVQQKKVEKWGSGNIKIPLTPAIEQILERCRDGVPSHHVIHRQPQRRVKATGRTDANAVLPNMITKTFSKARKTSGFYAPELESAALPSFHEIRSLGALLYEEAGMPKTRVQALLGHTSEAMTDTYLDRHKIRWNEVGSEEDFPKIFPIENHAQKDG